MVSFTPAPLIQDYYSILYVAMRKGWAVQQCPVLFMLLVQVYDDMP